MGYYSSLDIDLKSACYELSTIQAALDNSLKSKRSADLELIREALLTFISERKKINANYEDLVSRLYQIDVLALKKQYRLMHEVNR